MVASIAMRPCFSSTARRRLKFATLPSAVKPSGSQKPTGSCTPNSFSKARSGELVYKACTEYGQATPEARAQLGEAFAEQRK